LYQTHYLKAYRYFFPVLIEQDKKEKEKRKKINWKLVAPLQ